MLKDISSSSSEDEVDDAPTETLTEKPTTLEKKTTRYQCPADFVSFCHKPCSSTFTARLKKNKTELWLIKAPASFNPECFNGIKVPLSGLQTVKVPRAAGVDKSGSRQQIYNILASSHGTAELHLLTTKKQSSDRVIIGPAFSGQLNVSESYGDSSANLAPQIIPAAPAPSIPPGLKQRFHPFGSRTMAMDGISENETDGSIVRPSLTHLHPIVSKRSIEEVEHEREAEDGKKKRKKKEKQLKVAREEVEELKVETTAEFLNEAVTQLPLQEGDVSEKRKRKKKKKAREQAEAEEVTVKVEPMAEFEEFPFQNVEVSKTKKKKKKKDREREEEGVGVEPEVDLKVEEVVIKCEPTKTFCVDEVEGLGKKKKKKKKKSKNDD